MINIEKTKMRKRLGNLTYESVDFDTLLQKVSAIPEVKITSFGNSDEWNIAFLNRKEMMKIPIHFGWPAYTSATGYTNEDPYYRYISIKTKLPLYKRLIEGKQNISDIMDLVQQGIGIEPFFRRDSDGTGSLYKALFLNYLEFVGKIQTKQTISVPEEIRNAQGFSPSWVFPCYNAHIVKPTTIFF